MKTLVNKTTNATNVRLAKRIKFSFEQKEDKNNYQMPRFKYTPKIKYSDAKAR